MKKIYLLAVFLVTMAATAQQKGKPFSVGPVEAEISKLEPSSDYGRFDALYAKLDANLTNVSKGQIWQTYFDMGLVKYLETLKAKMPVEQVSQSSSWGMAYKTAMAAQTTEPNAQTNALVDLLRHVAGREVSPLNTNTPGGRLVSILANTFGENRVAELQEFLADPANAQQKWTLQVAKFLLP